MEVKVPIGADEIKRYILEVLGQEADKNAAEQALQNAAGASNSWVTIGRYFIIGLTVLIVIWSLIEVLLIKIQTGSKTEVQPKISIEAEAKEGKKKETPSFFACLRALMLILGYMLLSIMWLLCGIVVIIIGMFGFIVCKLWELKDDYMRKLKTPKKNANFCGRLQLHGD